MDALLEFYMRWVMIGGFRVEPDRVAYYPRGRFRPGVWLERGDPVLRRLQRVSAAGFVAGMIFIVPAVAVWSWRGFLPALVVVPVAMLLHRRAEAPLAHGDRPVAPPGFRPDERRRFLATLGLLVVAFAAVLGAAVAWDL